MEGGTSSRLREPRRLSSGAAAPSTVRGLSTSDVDQALALYAAGFFPMDDPGEAFAPLSFYAADHRALFELDARTRGNVRRRGARRPPAGAPWGRRGRPPARGRRRPRRGPPPPH